jgi:hypothetical protein
MILRAPDGDTVAEGNRMIQPKSEFILQFALYIF